MTIRAEYYQHVEHFYLLRVFLAWKRRYGGYLYAYQRDQSLLSMLRHDIYGKIAFRNFHIWHHGLQMNQFLFLSHLYSFQGSKIYKFKYCSIQMYEFNSFRFLPFPMGFPCCPFWKGYTIFPRYIILIQWVFIKY